MSYARLAGGAAVHAAVYEGGREGPARCIVCRCPVSHTRTYTSERKGRQVTVPAYFHLPKGGEHEQSCRYAVPARVIRLVAQSRDILDIDPQALPLIIERGGRNSEFRLHVLMEALQTLTER